MYNNLKWAMIQPLTGAAYLGTEEVIGHPAEFIISYPGLDKEYYNKEGKLINVGNERNLLEYLKKYGRNPDYYTFSHGMFDNPDVISFIDNDYFQVTKTPVKKLDNLDLDLVVAVPVCSGLSAANTAEHGKKDSTKNNNMRFITKYVLSFLEPKAYIFENAPGLFTRKGWKVRHDLLRIAEQYGYSITYIKTNTIFHNNIQNRPRTFVIFWKSKWPCKIGFEQKTKASVIDFLNEISPQATQDSPHFFMNDLKNNNEYKFIKQKFGNNWRKEVGNQRFKSFIIGHDLAEEFYQFHKNDKLKAHYDYCQHKLDIQKGYYDRTFFVCPDDRIPTIYHGNTWSMIHPVEDRTFTFRELMHAMGMPGDFDYLHTLHTFGSVIGQNVPAKTMGFWVSEICKNLIDWGNAIKEHPQVQADLLKRNCDFNRNVCFHDNTKKKFWYE